MISYIYDAVNINHNFVRFCLIYIYNTKTGILIARAISCKKGGENVIEPITYVILNHGKFGEELIKSAEMIVGKTKHIYAVSLLSGMSIEEYYEKVREQLKNVKGDILILTDLYGGTPSNVSMMLQREFSLHVICGVNLPMLIELILKRNNTINCVAKTLIKAGLEAAKASIMLPNEINFDDERRLCNDRN